MQSNKNNNHITEQVFEQRLDMYWQYLTVYLLVLIIWAVLRGSFSSNTISIVYQDPVVILLLLITIGTGITFLYNFYKKRTIIIGKDYIVFKTRWKEKTYTINDIIRIAFGKERNLRVVSKFRIIKFKVKNRRRIIRIRPTTFKNETELVQAISKLKKNIAH